MTSDKLRWEEIAREDPFWAVLAFPGQKYGRWDPERFFATGEREIAEVMSRGGAPSHPRRRESALDFGCGLGRLTRALSRRFDRAVGLDISETMVERARALNADFSGCEFRPTAGPTSGTSPIESFDLVYSGRVLQHLPGRGHRALPVAEFIRVARDDGLIAFQLPYELALPVRLEPRRNVIPSVAPPRLPLPLPVLATRVASDADDVSGDGGGGGNSRLQWRADPRGRATRDPEIGYVRECIYFVARRPGARTQASEIA